MKTSPPLPLPPSSPTTTMSYIQYRCHHDQNWTWPQALVYLRYQNSSTGLSIDFVDGSIWLKYTLCLDSPLQSCIRYFTMTTDNTGCTSKLARKLTTTPTLDKKNSEKSHEQGSTDSWIHPGSYLVDVNIVEWRKQLKTIACDLYIKPQEWTLCWFWKARN